MASSSSSPCSCTLRYPVALLLLFSIYFLQNVNICLALQTFGFEMHHRFSDQVKSIMGADNLPEIASREYYAAMAHRDRVFRGRALAENDDDGGGSKLLNIETSHIASLGYLLYANVSLGTPSVRFLVALDTGTNLLWVPCDCTICTRSVMSSSGDEINLNIYNMNSSSTSKYVSCNSSLCERKKECSEASSHQCPYRASYNANITSSGILVEDVLRLKTDNRKPKDIDARITFGCGQVQTGFYLNGMARNGLFGLGTGKTSVPSILSSRGLVADSFSMCFGSDDGGRISFGDTGSSDQEETPLNPTPQEAWYNITVSQLTVGGNRSDLDVTASFYSGTALTHLADPAYTALCDSFDSQILQKRSANPTDPYEYCYDVDTYSAEGRKPVGPNVTLIMKGGSKFDVYNPMIPINTNGITTAYCLGVVKSSDGNFIGHDFMTGHRIVFDREKMVLGWKASNCTDGNPPKASTTPSTDVTPPKASPPSTDDHEIPPTASPPVQPRSVNNGTSGNGRNSKAPEISVGKPRNVYLIASSLLMLFLPILQIV